MENLKPHELSNRCLEARSMLRHNLFIETALIERINELPEDDFCNSSRETLQLGAGYAYLMGQTTQLDERPHIEQITDVYFSMQPRNRYLSDDEREKQQRIIIDSALKVIDQIEVDEMSDEYEARALAAFIEGYAITLSGIARDNERRLDLSALA